MSSSGSDQGGDTSRDGRIEQCIRVLVAKTFAHDPDNLTLKRIRAKAEAELGLENGFLKADDPWNTKSKEIVADELSIQQNVPTNPESKEEYTKAPLHRPSADEHASPAAPRKAAKRKSGEDGPDDKKRRKVSSAESKVKGMPRKSVQAKRKSMEHSSNSDQDSGVVVSKASRGAAVISGEDSGGPAPKQVIPDGKPQRMKRPTIESSPVPASPRTAAKNGTEDLDVDHGHQMVQTNGQKPSDGTKDESDLSSLEDDSPPPKAKQRKKKGSTEPGKPTKPKPAKSEPKSKQESTPQEAEIKRLQGQLVKCGVRKVWGSYLKSYETPKQKVAHLRSLLEDVGMTGRFSEDKARQIKEERELKADIDAITEGEKKWGKATEKPGRKRLAKGLQELEGLVDEDGESD